MRNRDFVNPRQLGSCAQASVVALHAAPVYQHAIITYMRVYRLSLGLVLVAVLSACGDADRPSGPAALYHRDTGPLLPFPSDRLTVPADTATGQRPALAPFVAADDPVLSLYTDLVRELERLDGFGTSAPVTIGFAGDIDIAGLPGGAFADAQAQINASTAPASPVGLIDAASGARVAFTWRYAQDGHLLALYPADALDPKRTYIYYVTARLRDLDGASVRADARFAALMDSAPIASDATPRRRAHADTVRQDAARIAAEVDAPVVLADRFTTQSIYDETMALGARIAATYDETIANVRKTGRADEFDHVGAIYEADWVAHDYRDAEGRLDAAATEPYRRDFWPFFMAVPTGGTQPHPLVLVQHGLGDSRDVIFRVADQLAAQGFAAVAIDAPEHGARVPPPDSAVGPLLSRVRDSLGFWLERKRFDFDLHKIRDLFRQAVVDHAGFRQALRNTALPTLDFDGNGVGDLSVEDEWFYYGQSMGAIIGTMTVAQSPEFRVAALNVGGGRFSGYAFELPLLQAARPVVEVHAGAWAGGLRWFGLLQAILERGDPINYAARLQRRPFDGHPRRDLLMQFALNDGTVPNGLNWDLVAATGLPLLLPAPVTPPSRTAAVPLSGGVAGNLDGRTGGYVVFDRVTRRDGDRVVATHANTFASLEATLQAACLFRTAITLGVARIVDTEQGCRP